MFLLFSCFLSYISSSSVTPWCCSKWLFSALWAPTCRIKEVNGGGAEFGEVTLEGGVNDILDVELCRGPRWLRPQTNKVWKHLHQELCCPPEGKHPQFLCEQSSCWWQTASGTVHWIDDITSCLMLCQLVNKRWMRKTRFSSGSSFIFLQSHTEIILDLDSAAHWFNLQLL